tara:strand:+ start:2873 stop:4081 length:1209 start_codon:yes stop_codon:yes gene_type:complete
MKHRLASLVFLGCVFASLANPTHADDVSAATENAESMSEIQAGPRALSKAFRVAARRATPSVVTVFAYGQNVETTDEEDETDRPGPTPPQNESVNGDAVPLTGLGSGVILSETGLIITNNHVIAGAKKVVVQLADETEIEAAEVHGDPDSDVAIVRIERDKPFDVATLGDSDQMDIGDWVLAIGSPFKLEATVSAGIVSAKNRKLPRIRRGRLLQTDAAINPGNSGGPLVDLDGKMIAINTAIATRNGGYQGIGFAIPINQAKWIADELAAHGRVRRAALGISLAELNTKVAKKVNLPVGLGILVHQVIAGSAGARAGLKPMDVILEFAGERVLNPSNLREIIERKPIGSMQNVKISRAGKEMTLQVELASIEDPTLQKSEAEAEKEGESAEGKQAEGKPEE